MKSSSTPQSTTSLPRAPHEDSSARSMRYLAMMGVRVVCFVLMVVITPYGWYTWVLGAAAVFLPYIAVVLANVGSDTTDAKRETPELALPAAPEVPRPPADDAARVIRIEETRPATDPRSDA